MDIKETLEVFDAVDAQSDALVAACADGKLGLSDIKHELPVLAKARAAFSGLAAVKSELKDLDEDETELLVDRIATTGAKLVAAFAALTAVLGAQVA
jgi:hypothetical protein